MIGLQTGCPSGARLLAEGAEREEQEEQEQSRKEQEQEQKSRKSRRAGEQRDSNAVLISEMQ